MHRSPSAHDTIDDVAPFFVADEDEDEAEEEEEVPGAPESKLESVP